MRSLKHPELVSLALAMVDKLFQVEKERVLEADGVRLHPSEIHLLLFLDDHPDANAKEISDRFSVTKGAISQTLGRLERKGVVLRNRREEAPTEIRVDLTRKGERVMAKALAVKRAAEVRFDEDFSALTDAERQGVERFLRRVVER